MCVVKRFLACIFLIAFGLSNGIAATTLRCGSKVIRVGDTADRVRTHCGEPGAIEQESKFFQNGGTLGERCFFGAVTVENWIYERGYSGIPTTVTIVEGKVERIRLRTGGYDRGWVSPCR
jgi:hypothetical protein